MVWDLNETSYGMVYSWDVPMRCLIRMLFLEVILLAATAKSHFGVALLAAAAESPLRATLLAAAAEQYWEPYSGVTLLQRSHI